MHGHDCHQAIIHIDQASAAFVDRCDLAKHALRRGRSHRYHQRRFKRSAFALVPWRAASSNLCRVWLQVQANFSPQNEFEMFYRVGDIDLRPVDTSLIQCTIKHLACRSDRGLTREIFHRRGVLANEHYPARSVALRQTQSEWHPPERAGAAIGSFCAKRWDIVARLLVCEFVAPAVCPSLIHPPYLRAKTELAKPSGAPLICSEFAFQRWAAAPGNSQLSGHLVLGSGTKTRSPETHAPFARLVLELLRSFPVRASRSYWNGYLKLSFVSCPVALYPATSAAERVSFRQVNRRTGHRLRHKLVDSVTGEAVDFKQGAGLRGQRERVFVRRGSRP